MVNASNICTFENRVALVTGAADESGFITGVDIPVEGGRILGPHNCDM